MPPAPDDLAAKIVILFEDETMLVINKPAGLIVHTDGRTDEPSVVAWIRERYPNIEGVGESSVVFGGIVIDRPGIVHRLDRDTSGVLVIAKTKDAFLHLKRQFQTRAVLKTYLAFVHGSFREREGDIDLPIGRSKNDFRKWATGMDAREPARPAHTHYEVVAERRDAACVKLMPKTGRTHQIRVHMDAIGHPVVGDKRYAPTRSAILGFTRLALHAQILSIETPNGEQCTFEAPLPDDFLVAKELLATEVV